MKKSIDNNNIRTEAIRDLIHDLTNAELGRLIDKLAAQMWPDVEFAYEYPDIDGEGGMQWYSFPADTLSDGIEMERQDRGFGSITMFNEEQPYIHDTAFFKLSRLIDDVCHRAYYKDFTNVMQEVLAYLYTLILEHKIK